MNDTSEIILKAEDIRKSFGTLEVLKGISLEARNHDVISILGASGSGKSTFLRCLNFLEAPTSGKVIVHGEEVIMHNGKPKSLSQIENIRQRLGMVFQQFNLWSHRTVLENVMEGPVQVKRIPKAEARSKAESLLERVGLSDRMNMYPSQLSGGQQQRVAIARALVNDPAIILADEATGNLDSKTSIDIADLFVRLNDKGKTILMITHEPEIAQFAKRIIIFRDGCILSDETIENRSTKESALRDLELTAK